MSDPTPDAILSVEQFDTALDNLVASSIRGYESQFDFNNALTDHDQALRALVVAANDAESWENDAMAVAATLIETQQRLVAETRRADEAEAERDELAQQVMTVQVGDEYTLGHEHGSAVAVKYRDRAKTAEKRIADLEVALAEAADDLEELGGYEPYFYQKYYEKTMLSARAVLAAVPNPTTEPICETCGWRGGQGSVAEWTNPGGYRMGPCPSCTVKGTP